MGKPQEHKARDIDLELRARGHRLTPRRLMVAEVLSDAGGHMAMDEILARVQARYPSTNKTTVYRTLELLSSLGIVDVTDLGSGRLEYELSRHPHHHLICEKCGAQTEVEDRFFDPLRLSLRDEYGFVPNLGHFALFGLCPECAS
jgi:Fe2+ or Zn2+ uptake regulation protein